MVVDLLKTWLPETILPWALLLVVIGWTGYKVNDVASTIEQHYQESTQTNHVTIQICKAVSKTAGLDTKDCK